MNFQEVSQLLANHEQSNRTGLSRIEERALEFCRWFAETCGPDATVSLTKAADETGFTIAAIKAASSLTGFVSIVGNKQKSVSLTELAKKALN